MGLRGVDVRLGGVDAELLAVRTDGLRECERKGFTEGIARGRGPEFAGREQPLMRKRIVLPRVRLVGSQAVAATANSAEDQSRSSIKTRSLPLSWTQQLFLLEIRRAHIHFFPFTVSIFFVAPKRSYRALTMTNVRPRISLAQPGPFKDRTGLD